MNQENTEAYTLHSPIGLELESVIQTIEEDGQTLVHCLYISTNKYLFGGWVNIWPSTYLVDAESGEKIGMIQAFQIPLSPQKHFFQCAGQIKRFTLLFPRLPQSWKRFHFVEYTTTGNGFEVKDIMRNNSGVYQIEVK